MMVFFSAPGSFYNLPSVNDFIIDILLGSPSEEVQEHPFCDSLFFILYIVVHVYSFILCPVRSAV